MRDGDVLDWSEYRYGMVKNVHEKDDWAGFSAYKNKDYCIAIGHNLRDMFSHGGDGVCYAGAICGGKERHDRLLFPQKKIDDLVKDLDKRLKAAKNLQKQVTAMWKNREKKDEKDS